MFQRVLCQVAAVILSLVLVASTWAGTSRNLTPASNTIGVRLSLVIPETVTAEVQQPLFGQPTVQVTYNLGSGTRTEVEVLNQDDFIHEPPTLVAGQGNILLSVPFPEYAALDPAPHVERVQVLITSF